MSALDDFLNIELRPDSLADAIRPDARAELAALRERTRDLESVRDAALALVNIHDDYDDDSPFDPVMVEERRAVRSALQRLLANEACARAALRGAT